MFRQGVDTLLFLLLYVLAEKSKSPSNFLLGDYYEKPMANG